MTGSKKMMAFLVVGFLAACGTSESSETSSQENAPVSVAVSVEGTLKNVRVEGKDIHFWTVADIEYEVGCHQSDLVVSKRVEVKDGQYKIYASALVSELSGANAFCWHAFPSKDKHVETVVLGPGFIGKDSVELVNIDAAPGAAVEKPLGYITTVNSKLSVTNVSPLCPEKGTCVLGGSVVTVRSYLSNGCKRLGPHGYSVAQNEDGTVDLFVASYIFEPAPELPVACTLAIVPTTLKITLPGIYVDKGEINLKVLAK